MVYTEHEHTRVEEPRIRPERERDRSAQIVGAGFSLQAIGGAAAVVLTILGLLGIMPVYMIAISIIVIGAALLVEGAAIMARYSRMISDVEGGGGAATAQLGGGMSAELVGGLAGIVLGVLALLEIETAILSGVAVLVFGATLILGAGATSRLAQLRRGWTTEQHRAGLEVARQITFAAAGAQVLVGIAALVLGILALSGWMPVNMILIALLAVGASLLLTGAAVGGRMLGAHG